MADKNPWVEFGTETRFDMNFHGRRVYFVKYVFETEKEANQFFYKQKRSKELESCAKCILEIRKRDLSNPKYDSLFDDLKLCLIGDVRPSLRGLKCMACEGGELNDNNTCIECGVTAI